MSESKVEVVGRECVLARYGVSNKSQDDVLLVKEKVHYSDGTVTPKLVPYINYKRSFYIAKKGCRDYHQKKEWESIDRLEKYESTQANLANAIGNALGRKSNKNLKYVCSSPYVYGADITSTSLIKHEYRQKWPDLNTGMTLAVLDYEADVLEGDAEVMISGSLTFKDKAILAVTKDFVSSFDEPEALIRKAFTEYLGQYEKERNIKLEIVIVDTPALITTKLIDKAHEWQPDIIGIWNMPYDMNLMINTLKGAGIRPEDVFSDPKVPDEYRFFKWNEKTIKKDSAGGKSKNKHYAELWHTASHLAGFCFIDVMSLYCILRIAKGKKSSYKLDYILQEELGIEKLKFKEADGYVGLDWHRFMQRNYKIEYLIYNIFDCISVELLDEKTADVCKVLPTLVGISPISRFDSNPTKLANEFNFFCLDKGRVMGTTGINMVSDDDKKIMGMNDWIITLPSHLCDKSSALNIMVESDCIETGLYAMVSDLDVKGSYPTTEVIANVSKETTHSELCKVEGLTEKQQREIGVNMTSPFTNAVEISTSLFGLPDLDELVDIFSAEQGID